MADQTEVPGVEVAPARPVLRVVRGTASPEELAAIVAVLAARSGGVSDDATPEPPSLWWAPQLRAPMPTPGPGAWTSSTFRQ